MRLLDEQYTKTPFYGIRKMTVHLRSLGHCVNHKRVRRLLREMGLEAVYPKPSFSKGKESIRYPYLLRGTIVERPNHVWSTDITYIPMGRGHVYLTAVIDWFSRYVLSWRLSNTFDQGFCLEALEAAFEYGQPEIFNTDQGSQFTSNEFTGRLSSRSIAISWDGKGRALDNIFVERLWRTLKYEEVYLNSYSSVNEARSRLENYFRFYNMERIHQSLGYVTPHQAYHAKL